MRRRKFLVLVGSGTAWPLLVRTQERVRHIGVLVPLAEDDPEQKGPIAAFRQELERLGWTDGRNVRFTYRYSSGGPLQFPQLVKEMIALRPEVIFAQSTGMVSVVKRETNTIPVVFVNVSDPIGSGFVESLARPGGILTGPMLFEAGVAGKWLAMLKEVAPATSRALLMANPKTTAYDYFLRMVQPAAISAGIELIPAHVENTADMDRAVETFARTPGGGMVLLPDSTNFRARHHIVALAAKHRVPAVYPERPYVEAGGLMHYGTHRNELFRLAATYVDRILRGANPAEIPVQVPSENRKAARVDRPRWFTGCGRRGD